MPQPSEPVGRSAAAPGSITGRMNASSAARPPAAMIELITPAKSTRKLTTAIERTASQFGVKATVPSAISAAPPHRAGRR